MPLNDLTNEISCETLLVEESKKFFEIQEASESCVKQFTSGLGSQIFLQWKSSAFFD